jgi:hypothetical protein
MAFTYDTVNIDGNDYNVFGDQEDADLYLVAGVSSGAVAWRAITDDDDKGRNLVAATRWLNALTWQGEKTDDANALKWPRSGIPDVDEDTIPIELKEALFELAAAFADDPDLRTSFSAALARSLTAGSVSISFFRSEQVQQLGPVPDIILGLIGKWLGDGTGSVGGPWTSGTDGTSTADDDFGFNNGIG